MKCIKTVGTYNEQRSGTIFYLLPFLRRQCYFYVMVKNATNESKESGSLPSFVVTCDE